MPAIASAPGRGCSSSRKRPSSSLATSRLYVGRHIVTQRRFPYSRPLGLSVGTSHAEGASSSLRDRQRLGISPATNKAIVTSLGTLRPIHRRGDDVLGVSTAGVNVSRAAAASSQGSIFVEIPHRQRERLFQPHPWLPAERVHLRDIGHAPVAVLIAGTVKIFTAYIDEPIIGVRFELAAINPQHQLGEVTDRGLVGRARTCGRGRPTKAAATEAQTAISASRGLVDFLRTHRISFALTSYQTGQLMLIGVLPNGSLSVFQRNFVRAMGLWAAAQTTLSVEHRPTLAARERARCGPSGEQAIRPALRAPHRADHGRSRYSRDCDGTRRPAGVRQHQIFVPRHFRSRAQLQEAVAPELCLKARARGPLSSEWARDVGRRAQICHRRQPQRRGRRLARAACARAASSSMSRPAGS